MRTLRIGLCQINATVGDIEGNTRKIIDFVGRGKRAGADLLAFPELAVTGYPPEDLLLMPDFIESNLRAVERIARATSRVTAIVGFVHKRGDIYDAAALLHDGKMIDVYGKTYLPNYGVFDEYRYFQAGTENFVFSLGSTAIGLSICEDIWYPGEPVRGQALYGSAELLVNISSSPYHAGKSAARERMISVRASDNTAIVAYCNLVGGQDELVFDGASLVCDQNGDVLARGKQFEEDLILADLDLDAVFRMRLQDPKIRRDKLAEEGKELRRIDLPVRGFPAKKRPPIPTRETRPMERLPEIYAALVLGARDYVLKNGFRSVVIGLSGGIDSSLTAAIARDALGKDKVVGVMMPSRYTTRESVEDAERSARSLGIRLLNIPIENIFSSYLATLAPRFKGRKPDVAEENIQARIRGNILMALSNKFGWLVLATGNKSELSVGYCTLYGDMAGGYAVLKDAPKTLVYELSEWRNQKEGKPLIPERVLRKPPTAELRPDQRDEDSLPPYAALDPILKAYVEDDKGLADIVSMGFKKGTVREVMEMVDRNEYKRRQSAPGVKISHRALGKDRRLPITNKYRTS